MIRKQLDAFNLDGRAMSNELLPIFLRRIGNRSSDYTKVLRAFVAANIKEIAAMIDVVFMIGLARDDYLPGCTGVIRRNVAKFVRRFAERAQQDHGFVARAIDANVEQLVLLFINQIV